MRVALKVLARLGLLRFLNLTISYWRNGRVVKIPVIKGMGAQHANMSEPWMCEILEKILPMKAGSFLDVGVNLGQSLIKLKLIDSDIAYIGVDPNPVCIYYTKELIHANNYSNAILIPVGISSDNELVSLNFYTDGDTDSSASIIEGLRPDGKIFRKEIVACVEYSEIERAVGVHEVAIVKIDVEGAELEVLNGIKNELKEKRPFVLIEILPVYYRENEFRWNRQQQIEQIISDCNYRLFLILKSPTGFKTFQPLRDFGVNSDIDLCDYFFCPAEDVDRLMNAFA